MIKYSKFKSDKRLQFFSAFSIFFTEHQYSAEHSLGNAGEDYRVNKHFFEEWTVAFVAAFAKLYRLMSETLCIRYPTVGEWHNFLLE
jgi:hypothetical protein